MDPSDPPRDGPKEAPLAPIAEGGAAKDAAPVAPAPPPDPAAGKPPRDQKDAPLRKLTTGLLGTYKLINQRYYEAKKARQARSKAEEYQVVPGDMLGGHYKVDESLGKGSFGQVVSATDSRSGAKVAVKVIKNKDAFRRQARTEIRLLELLNKKDPDDQWCIGEAGVAEHGCGCVVVAHDTPPPCSLAVRFLETFDHLGHTCIVFEHLSYNLYELIRKTHFRGVALQLIRKFARQILKSLAYLALPEVDIIHCDLKPENILFRVAVSEGAGLGRRTCGTTQPSIPSPCRTGLRSRSSTLVRRASRTRRCTSTSSLASTGRPRSCLSCPTTTP